MTGKKIGYIENSSGEKSHSKLINLVVAICIMVGWIIVSAFQRQLVEIDPTLLGLLGLCMGANSLNKWIRNGSKPNDQEAVVNALKALKTVRK